MQDATELMVQSLGEFLPDQLPVVLRMEEPVSHEAQCTACRRYAKLAFFIAARAQVKASVSQLQDLQRRYSEQESQLEQLHQQYTQLESSYQEKLHTLQLDMQKAEQTWDYFRRWLAENATKNDQYMEKHRQQLGMHRLPMPFKKKGARMTLAAMRQVHTLASAINAGDSSSSDEGDDIPAAGSAATLPGPAQAQTGIGNSAPTAAASAAPPAQGSSSRSPAGQAGSAGSAGPAGPGSKRHVRRIMNKVQAADGAYGQGPSG